MAKSPLQRKLWALRKFYGNLPPTDPRILDMTPELIELEFMHLELDRQEKQGQSATYTDDEYDQWDEETEQFDRNVTDGDEPPRSEELIPVQKPYREEDWEDVEIDDLEDWET